MAVACCMEVRPVGSTGIMEAMGVGAAMGGGGCSAVMGERGGCSAEMGEREHLGLSGRAG